MYVRICPSNKYLPNLSTGNTHATTHDVMLSVLQYLVNDFQRAINRPTTVKGMSTNNKVCTHQMMSCVEPKTYI